MHDSDTIGTLKDSGFKPLCYGERPKRDTPENELCFDCPFGCGCRRLTIKRIV